VCPSSYVYVSESEFLRPPPRAATNAPKLSAGVMQ
jgi:hypothetical protein